MIYSNSKRRDLERVSAENICLKDRIAGYQAIIKSLQGSLKAALATNEKQRAGFDEVVAQKEAVIKELSNQVAHMAAISSHDGSNTGIPTAATPINKKKVIPNSRRSTGKKKGGQPGHVRHALEPFSDSEITETQIHGLCLEEEACDACGGTLSDTGETVSKDEFDVEIKVVKKRHQYRLYECSECGKGVRVPIEKRHKEKNQYGGKVQAFALSLMATGNVAINKVRMLAEGMTGGEMKLSEGFICKLYKRAAQGLAEFQNALKKVLVARTLVYWDDTVIMIQTKRACMRFYGDERISYYTAHDAKGMEGLIGDGILEALTGDTTVMHDHNRVNYNDRFSFANIECNQHLIRDLQKISDDNPGHKWAGKLKEHITSAIKKRKDLVVAGVTSFPKGEVKRFKAKVQRLLKAGSRENAKSSNCYAASFEKTVLKRIAEYEGNYFSWVDDFSLPTTDNLSERGLRGIKSHMKISGQFESEKTAKYYAVVKTYVETCRKNRINEMDALSRLCEGNPYTVEEIFT